MEGHGFPCFGVDEGKIYGMQSLAAGPEGFVVGDDFVEAFVASAVDGIAQERVFDVGHVDADLVGATCFQATFHKANSVMECLQDLIMGDGFFAPGNHAHALSVIGAKAHGGGNCAHRFFKDAPAEGMVGAFE